MKTKTIIGILLIVAGAWKLANLWGIIENDWLWHQPWTAYVAPVLLLWVGATIIVDSYRRDIERPIYANLTSSTVYVNRYTYQSGNPYLLPTYTHSLVLNAAYKWANLMLNYGRVKDALTMSTEPFPGSEDPLVSLVRPINSWEDYNQFSIQLAARPVIGCWHPAWSVITQIQDFKSPTAVGSTHQFSRA